MKQTQVHSNAQSSTNFFVTICPHGLGNCGDNTSPTSGGNASPKHNTRSVTLVVLDGNDTAVASFSGTVAYVPSSHNFQGTISAPNIPTGLYLVIIRMPGYLGIQIPRIISVTQGQQVTLPEVSLVTGDINGDNTIDIRDYQSLISCIGNNASSCAAPITNQNAGADLDDDGVVDGIDYNLLLREMSTAQGSSVDSQIPSSSPSQSTITSSPTVPLQPTSTPKPTFSLAPGTGHPISIVMFAPWLSISEFQSMIAGNLTSNDQIKYRVTNYPSGYDANAVIQLKAIKATIPGLKLGVDIAYSANIVKYAQQIKSEGFDFVEYDLEANFDGPNDAASAPSDVAQIKAAADAVHAQGMTFRVTPGRPNSSTFLKAGDLPQIAKMVDYYQIQNQSTQAQGPTVYSSFTAQVTQQLKSANPNIIVTAQVSPGQGAASGETVLQTMEDDIAASMAEPAPGNVDGTGMWIASGDVPVATSFFSWFNSAYH